MQERKSFGKFIREKRLERGYSQQQLAEQLFISESSVSKWERGVNYPDITILSDLCRVLDITEHELITASNDTEYRKLKKDAYTYRKLNRAAFVTCTAVYALALVICFICNLAIDHTLSWFWVVLGSLLCAYSVFPSYSRFFSDNKFFWFLVTSLGSVTLLLFICGLYTHSIAWVPTAAAGVLLGYTAVFGPVLMKKYSLPSPLSRAKLLLYVSALWVLTVLVLCAARLLTAYPLGRSVLAALYCYAPLLLLGVVFVFVKDRWFRAGAGVALVGLDVYGMNYVIDHLLDSGEQTAYYQVNFHDWGKNVNGNIMCLLLIATAAVSLAFFIAGWVRKKHRK